MTIANTTATPVITIVSFRDLRKTGKPSSMIRLSHERISMYEKQYSEERPNKLPKAKKQRRDSLFFDRIGFLSGSYFV